MIAQQPQPQPTRTHTETRVHNGNETARSAWWWWCIRWHPKSDSFFSIFRTYPLCWPPLLIAMGCRATGATDCTRLIRPEDAQSPKTTHFGRASNLRKQPNVRNGYA